MAAMARFSVRAAIHLQHRVLSISWVKKSCIVTCLRTRVYSSSGPVRYTPKRSLNDHKSRTSEIVNGIEFNGGLDVNDRRIEVRHKDAEWRTNFYDELRNGNQNEKGNYSAGRSIRGVENEFDDSLSFVDDLLEEPDAIDEESNINDKKCYHGNKSKQDAEKLAIELLALRAFTAVELRKKLLAKKISPYIAEAVVNDFKSRGLINDGLYAETYSHSRWASSSWGPRKINQALVNKGIGREVAQKAIKLVFEDGEESGDGMSNVELSKVSLDHLFIQASKRWLRGQDVSKETRKSRIVRWLQYRGFDWDVTRTILKKLEAKYPP